MTSRERFMLTFEHKEPDRIPFDIGSTPDSSININTYRRLRDFYGLKPMEARLCNIVTQCGYVENDLREVVGIDTIPVYSGEPSDYRLEITRPGDGYSYFTSSLGIGFRMPEDGGLYYDICRNPLGDAETVADIEKYPWPDPADPGFYKGMEAAVKRLYEETDYAIVLNSAFSGMMETCCWLRGMENFVMDLAMEPALACAMMDKMLELKMEFWTRALSLVGDYISALDEADDLGIQTSMLISPEMYRKYIKPRHTKLFSHIHKLAPKAKIFFHTCGAVRPIIGDLIESGIDALNPVQFACPGMDAAELKKEFGKDLTFWGGGINTQTTLPRGTPAQVKEEVRRQIDALAQGGGYIFATVHNIQADVPTENLAAMIEAFQQECRYK